MSRARAFGSLSSHRGKARRIRCSVQIHRHGDQGQNNRLDWSPA